MHGAVGGTPGIARRGLRAILVLAITMGLLAVASGSALAKRPATRKKQTITAHTAVNEGSSYLALGDSVTFGYEESQVVPAPNYTDASSFIGYPEQFGAELHLNVVNASCPGETSASLIDSTAQSNGCENSVGGGKVGYRTLFPLHVSYSGSQLDFAVGYLRTHRDVRLVSLMIGANDFFVCQETTADHCTAASELAATAAAVSKNVATILSAIRWKAHYGGQIAIVNYYSLDYSSAADNASSALLNSTQDNAAAPFHVEIADGFGELEAAAAHSGGSTCNAGLLTQLVGASTPCGIHPSYAGQTLLAASLAKVVRVSGPFWPFW
jgi:lysophospholipase L1-like esterase